MLERVTEWRRSPARCRELERQVAEQRRLAEMARDAYARELDARVKQLEDLELELSRYSETAGFSGLSPAEIERLAILGEECGEVVKTVGKVLRFGWDSQSPYGGKTNVVALEREIGSVRAIVNLMLDAKDVRLDKLQSWQRAKRGALERWTLYQSCSMPREEQLAMMEAIEAQRIS